MIGSRRSLGNLRRTAVRLALLAPLLALLAGCADVFFATVGKLGAAHDVVRTPDIAFDAGHGLALDVYAPRTADQAPVVVFFYGGSWESGKRGWYRYVGDALASNGIVAVVPDYRKYPEVRFPEFVRDGARAVAWARAHAREFGGDPSRLFVMGHTAGGQIAALLAVDKRYLAEVDMQPRELAGMVGLAGAYAFLPFAEAESRIFGSDRQSLHDSQPIEFVDGDEPPLLLLQGADDGEVPPASAEAMAARARAAGTPVTLRIYPGVGHASILLSFARGRAATVPSLADVVSFVAAVPPGAGLR
jgi:acetyl esterase/lipase